jgi:hypothetical protein
MQVSLGERDGNNGVRERCSRVRQWTPIGFEWHERSASAAAEERRGVGTNIGRYVPLLEQSGETEDSNPVLSGKELGELPTTSAAFDDCHRRLFFLCRVRLAYRGWPMMPSHGRPVSRASAMAGNHQVLVGLEKSRRS